MNYQQAMEYIEQISQSGSVYGLETMQELCRRLGNPQDDLQFVHIAGTNGKGSVLSFVSSVLICAGYRTGCYISPVIRDYRERVQVNGRKISQRAVAQLLTRIREACREMTQEGRAQPTAFEIETALAFLYFKQTGCQIVVLETGLGGRLDATNVIRNTLAAVFTSISMDHTALLGDSLEKIASEKAGIIKQGCLIITAPQEPEVWEILKRAAEKEGQGGRVYSPDMEKTKRIRYGLEKQKFDYQQYRDLEISLAGKHQIVNAVTAVEVIEGLQEKGFPVGEAKLKRGLLEARWEGRFSIIQKRPLFIADGAHNRDGAKKLADSVRFYFTNRRIIYIIGVLKDKDYEAVLAETYAYAEHIVTLTPPDNQRALPAYELACAARNYHPNVTAADSVEEAVEIAELLAKKEDVILAFGSLSYLGRLMDTVEKKQKGKGKKK